jgi:hypothetical protein
MPTRKRCLPFLLALLLVLPLACQEAKPPGSATTSRGPGSSQAQQMEDYYRRVGLERTAEFYRQIDNAKSASARQMENYYRRVGLPRTAEFYRQMTVPQK